MKPGRTVDDLEKVAVRWWPREISKSEADLSVLPYLIQTRPRFEALLKLAGNEPFDLLEIAAASDFPGNLLVKHLMVLTDLGGEGLRRIGNDFGDLFPLNRITRARFMEFTWHDQTYRYEFGALPLPSGRLSNSSLGVDGLRLLVESETTQLQRDVIVILLHASANIDREVAIKGDFEKCVVGSILGNSQAVDDFTRERYIWVSRITGGATANQLGQVAQDWVSGMLKEFLGPAFAITKNGKIVCQGIAVTSDVQVQSPSGKVFGIEVSFQVTTNSTIERKGNEAEGRLRLLHGDGHFACYVVDGAGNLERRSAISKICSNSDCTVAFSRPEIQILANFIKENSD